MEYNRIKPTEEEKLLKKLPIKKLEEINFFLNEYEVFNKEIYDFYYVIPFEWLLEWNNYITSYDNDNKPPEIITEDLLDSNQVIKQNLIENVDFAIIPRSVSFYFHDNYFGSRRLKTKYRHVFTTCLNDCQKHDLHKKLSVFNYQHLLKEGVKKYNSDYNITNDNFCNIVMLC